jgi:hypothetical protein
VHKLAADTDLEPLLREGARAAVELIDIPALDAELSKKRPVRLKPYCSKVWKCHKSLRDSVYRV